MAKPAKHKSSKTPPAPLPELKNTGLFAFDTFRKQLFLLLTIGFLFYANSLWNEYALDDGAMIKENSDVLHGTKGLKNIFTKHSMSAFYAKYGAEDQFAGGRYRPISIATFAIEQRLFGMNPGDKVEVEDDNGHVYPGTITALDAFFVQVEYTAPDGKQQTAKVLGPQISTFHTETFARHFNNVLLFLLTIACVFYFMREQVFRDRPQLAFLCTLLFAIHPLHTEVIDNVKSRDELMTLLFSVTTLIFAFSYVEKKKIRYLILGMVSLMLAVMSKESGGLIIILLPFFFYIVTKKSFGKSMLASVPYFIVIGVYLAIRFSIIPLWSSSHFKATEVLNNQYIAPGSAISKFATKIYVLSRYLWLQIYPGKLCVDYSYNQIPFIELKDPRFWFSFSLHLGIVTGAFVLFLRRHVLSFFLLFYLGHLFLISNLLTEIGTTLGERLIYSPSFAFCVIAGYGIYLLLEKIPDASRRKLVLTGLCIILTVVCGARVIIRNVDWKNDSTIFTHDLPLAPNSVLVNGNAGKAYIDLSSLRENKAQEMDLVKKAIPPLRHALELHPSYVNGYLNLGVAYYKLGMLDSTYNTWMRGHQLSPRNGLMHQYGGLFMNRGLEAARKNDFKTALEMLTKASNLDQNNPEVWANLGGAYFTMKEYEKAKEVWETALRLDPNHAEANRGYQAVLQILKQTPSGK